MTTRENSMDEYLQTSEVVDWRSPAVLALAKELAAVHSSKFTGLEVQEVAIARACFEWVRDNIRHSFDYQQNPVTCRASDVLHHKTGYCFAKSHLLAALLRANHIPAGFCYQRLSIDDTGAPYSLHGLNAVCLPDFGWYRIDPRGNKPGVNAQFTPPKEQLAFSLQFSEETDFKTILSEPLPMVVESLQTYHTWEDVLSHLPDCTPEKAKSFGLV
ncbi:MAG: transglutaminase family protein [Cyanobacteria bacterium J06614_10]